MGKDSEERLKAIRDFTEFGSGLKIATRDLQIRGAGSIFGEVQHGHMVQVGYDMYNELLKEAVAEIRGEKIVDENREIQIDINVSAYIPDTFIENPSQKIEIYQDIADCRSNDEISDVIDEIIDRYGNYPEEVQNLINIAKLKVLALKTKINRIKQVQNKYTIYFDDISPIEINKIAEVYFNRVRFSQSGSPFLTLKQDDSVTPFEDLTNFIKLVRIGIENRLS